MHQTEGCSIKAEGKAVIIRLMYSWNTNTHINTHTQPGATIVCFYWNTMYILQFYHKHNHSCCTNLLAAVIQGIMEKLEGHVKADDISVICVLLFTMSCPMKQKCTKYK